ncbi:hypothetical protein EVAR_50586_1 [Eumeta japonica]|uniref:Uncharacterized protein n=1 Tax=Eumeta variegata TaxID=151549 RepID=A0A4C1Y6L3_EUMVA|nr:hypothetical protein EVAR_50586_1 [Eumeta japonica]
MIFKNENSTAVRDETDVTRRLRVQVCSYTRRYKSLGRRGACVTDATVKFARRVHETSERVSQICCVCTIQEVSPAPVERARPAYTAFALRVRGRFLDAAPFKSRESHESNCRRDVAPVTLEARGGRSVRPAGTVNQQYE